MLLAGLHSAPVQAELICACPALRIILVEDLAGGQPGPPCPRARLPSGWRPVYQPSSACDTGSLTMPSLCHERSRSPPGAAGWRSDDAAGHADITPGLALKP